MSENEIKDLQKAINIVFDKWQDDYKLIRLSLKLNNHEDVIKYSEDLQHDEEIICNLFNTHHTLY